VCKYLIQALPRFAKKVHFDPGVAIGKIFHRIKQLNVARGVVSLYEDCGTASAERVAATKSLAVKAWVCSVAH